MEEGLFHNPVFVKHISEFAVACVGHSEGHTEVEHVDPRTGQKSMVCPRYESIPCEGHQKTYQQAGGKFKFQYVPASFVCDSQGGMVSEVKGQAPQPFIDALNEAQRKIGKAPITGSMLAKWENELLKGDVNVAKGKFKKAVSSYQEVAEDEDAPEFMRARGTERMEALKDAALKAIQEAAAEDPRKAKRALKKLEKEFEDIPEAKAALEAALSELEGS